MSLVCWLNEAKRRLMNATKGDEQDPVRSKGGTRSQRGQLTPTTSSLSSICTGCNACNIQCCPASTSSVHPIPVHDAVHNSTFLVMFRHGPPSTRREWHAFRMLQRGKNCSPLDAICVHGTYPTCYCNLYAVCAVFDGAVVTFFPVVASCIAYSCW